MSYSHSRVSSHKNPSARHAPAFESLRRRAPSSTSGEQENVPTQNHTSAVALLRAQRAATSAHIHILSRDLDAINARIEHHAHFLPAKQTTYTPPPASPGISTDVLASRSLNTSRWASEPFEGKVVRGTGKPYIPGPARVPSQFHNSRLVPRNMTAPIPDRRLRMSSARGPTTRRASGIQRPIPELSSVPCRWEQLQGFCSFGSQCRFTHSGLNGDCMRTSSPIAVLATPSTLTTDVSHAELKVAASLPDTDPVLHANTVDGTSNSSVSILGTSSPQAHEHLEQVAPVDAEPMLLPTGDTDTEINRLIAGFALESAAPASLVSTADTAQEEAHDDPAYGLVGEGDEAVDYS